MARRRGKGEGTIFKRKDGLWQGAVTIGHDAEGRQQRKTVYGRTQREVQTKIDALKQRHVDGSLTSEDLKLGAFLERWLDTKERQVKPRTVESYRYTVERYINPRLAKLSLSKLTPFKLQVVLAEIAEEVSPHTSNYCRSTLNTAFRQAVRWRLIMRNPMEGVERVRAPKKEVKIWTPEETTQFLKAAQEHRLYALFYLAITSGLRSGELLALRWDDLASDLLQVRRNLTKHKGKMVLSTPKTRKGQRVVTLPVDTLGVLDNHRVQQEAEMAFLQDAWERPEFMFVSEIGTLLDHRNVLRSWHKLQEKAGVPRTGLHSARHLHVSLLIRHGLDAKTIADRVGHKNITTTLNQYAHLFDEQRRAAAVPLDELLNPSNDDNVEED